ncbi:MAG: CrcB family protein [Acidimicrobiia bacterium]
MTTALLVAAGGAVGSLARYALAGVINLRGHPWGTIVVNLLGSFILGVLLGMWGFKADAPTRVAVAVGILGGFTTFSTFALDTLYLWDVGQPTMAIVNVLVSVGVGIAAAFGGLVIGRSFA